MNAMKWAKFGLVFLATVGCCLPEMAIGAAGTAAPAIADVRLEEGGVLFGQLVTPQNIGVAGAEVALCSGADRLAVAKTSEDGYFAFRGLRSGVYQVETSKGMVPYRVWSAATAPPSAQAGTLIVMGDETVLGQCCLPGGRFIRSMLSNPWIVAAIVTTAIAVPVAIHNARGASSP